MPKLFGALGPCEKSSPIFSTKDPRKYVGTSRPSFIRPIQVEELTLRESKLRCALDKRPLGAKHHAENNHSYATLCFVTTSSNTLVLLS